MIKKQKGFTLIELLVVIAIISLLSSVIMAQLNEARAKARDARRISDLENIQIALELYRDRNGQYPVRNALSSNPTSWNALESDLSNWMAELPVDPLVNNGTFPQVVTPGEYNYYYGSNTGDEYNLIARLEDEGFTACSNRNYLVNLGSDGYISGFSTDSSWCPSGVADPRNLLFSDH